MKHGILMQLIPYTNLVNVSVMFSVSIFLLDLWYNTSSTLAHYTKSNKNIDTENITQALKHSGPKLNC